MPLDPYLVSVISACTALVASIAGPLVTLRVSRRQFDANVLSANRQKWIEALRDTLSEFIALLVSALVLKKQWKEQWNQGMGALEKDPALIERLERVVLAQSRIWLLINPNEPTHQQLSTAMDSAMALLQSERSDDAESARCIEAITALARAILRAEWQRVKHGI